MESVWRCPRLCDHELAACAPASKPRQRANYDLAVVEYTKAVRANPNDDNARLALDRAKLRAAQEHAFPRAARSPSPNDTRKRSASTNSPRSSIRADATVDEALREIRQKLRTKIAVTRNGKTELESLIERARATAASWPRPAGRMRSFPTRSSSARPAAATSSARSRNSPGLNVVFDPAFREETINADLRKMTLADALTSVTASTRTFYRVSAQRTITIVPDTPAKRREYEDRSSRRSISATPI